MAWCRIGDKPLSEPIPTDLPTHICGARGRWVKIIQDCHYTIWHIVSGDWSIISDQYVCMLHNVKMLTMLWRQNELSMLFGVIILLSSSSFVLFLVRQRGLFYDIKRQSASATLAPNLTAQWVRIYLFIAVSTDGPIPIDAGPLAGTITVTILVMFTLTFLWL